ncbi:NAD(P)-dependent oxidoreductase, partial [Streptomyces mirabilis]
LRSGDSVTAFVRNPAALADLADRVTLATGDARMGHGGPGAAPEVLGAVLASAGAGSRSRPADTH